MTTTTLKSNVFVPVELPGRKPLLTRAGWSAFMVALIVVCAVAPVLNLWVPEGSVFHLSD